MNILICSVGRRVKLVEYFKEELHKISGKVVAIDCDHTAAALHHADIYEVVPRINDSNYINHIKNICFKYNISGVISLIDPELTLLASYKEDFLEDGIHILVSEKEVVDICYDKYLTYRFLLDNDLPSVPSYIDIEKVIIDLNSSKISFPLIVKPRNGSASIGLKKVTSIKELRAFQNHDIIVQPFISGEEFGVDCYIDIITSEPTNIFMKRKISMRAGETDKSVAIKDAMLKQIIEKLIYTLKPSGPIDIDCFKTENGYLISEINPRFGGGYLHAHVAGQNFVKKIINNLNGNSNLPNDSEYEEGTTLVKFDTFIFI